MRKKTKLKPTYKDYLEGTAKVLRKSKAEKEKYEVKIFNRKFVVYPNVFSPKYFFDTEFFARELPIRKDEEFLEDWPRYGSYRCFCRVKRRETRYCG